MGDFSEKTYEIAQKEIPGATDSSYKETMNQLDSPLSQDIDRSDSDVKNSKPTEKLDQPLNQNEVREKQAKTEKAVKYEKMENQIHIVFKCPDGADKKEFERQIKAQERGLNSQTVAENMDNRAAYEQRKDETGNGRDTSDGMRAQRDARDKALTSRIANNEKAGMSREEAKAEAEAWIKTQAALHNPDQVAGGDPGKVSRMGDASINSSIGGQWKSRVSELANGLDEYAKGKTREELEHTKLNVKLSVE